MNVSSSSMNSFCSSSPKNVFEQTKISPLTNNIFNDNYSMHLLFSKSIALEEMNLEENEQIINQNQQQFTDTESSFEDSFTFSSNIIDSFRAKNEIKALVNLF